KRRLAQPHCATAVSTPYAAVIDSRFITAALTAMTTDRNTVSSSSIDSPTTTAISHGSFWPMALAKLTLPAFGPVTYALIPVPAVARGSTVPASRFTSALLSASCSRPVGGRRAERRGRGAARPPARRRHARDAGGGRDGRGEPGGARRRRRQLRGDDQRRVEPGAEPLDHRRVALVPHRAAGLRRLV